MVFVVKVSRRWTTKNKLELFLILFLTDSAAEYKL